MHYTEWGKPLIDVAVHTSREVIVHADANIDVYSNRGAGATVRFKLPPAKVGMRYAFYVEAAQRLEVDPDGTETIAIAGTAQAGGSYIYADAVGEFTEIICLQDGKWTDTHQRGTWTVGVG